jgi:hypothetical protein
MPAAHSTPPQSGVPAGSGRGGVGQRPAASQPFVPPVAPPEPATPPVGKEPPVGKAPPAGNPPGPNPAEPNPPGPNPPLGLTPPIPLSPALARPPVLSRPPLLLPPPDDGGPEALSPSPQDARTTHDTQRNREILVTAGQPYNEFRDEPVKKLAAARSGHPARRASVFEGHTSNREL